ncbi:MAG TPA: sigma 54-interacting transcriptional regulator, partial [Gemmatimonadales bacterium]|nr:sigma 54-interacting transcriptional regulator [Gemmatimonadales bacterium]
MASGNAPLQARPGARHHVKQSPAPPDALRLLVVDDDLLSARLVAKHLERPGRVHAAPAGSAEEALERLAREHYDAVLLDLVMPGMDGFELVRRIRESDRSLPVFIMTAHATVEGAVEGIRAGATDFLPKPLEAGAVLALVERAVSDRTIREEITTLRERRAAADAAERVFGTDPRLAQVRRTARQIAAAPDARVLITGESGTGKSLLARLIHDLSGARGRFVEVNCAALPPQLLESELFGHEKGAFTDASALKRGLIEMGQGGTLFLDEIGAMPPELQAKLLLFLESREIRRVGGVHSIPVR